MNKNILQKETQTFIQQNLDSDLTKLILKGSSFDEVSIQELAEQIISKKKCKKKLPTWFNTNNIYYPNKLNIEQTSSEVTANYKATLIQGKTIIDITGGFGVDCLGFSKTFNQVTHCEINSRLSKITKHNWKQLQITNINTVIGNGIDYLKENEYKYDCIYVDPSRRDDLKKRVFLLEDCTPNLLKKLDFLFTRTDTVLVKTAPILDIKAAIQDLQFVKEVHIIAVDNDVKEVLYILKKNQASPLEYKTINFSKNKKQIFSFIRSTKEISYSLPKKYVFEPNAAILKAGAFQEVSSLLGVDKLHKHSHLYTASKTINFPGRVFQIIKTLPYNPKKICLFLTDDKANITIRNFPESVAKIRKKTKIKEGGDTYLFFTTNCKEEKIVLICVKP